MRGKLIAFVMLLAVSGLIVGSRYGGDLQFIPASLRSTRELENVPEREGLPLPEQVRVALTNAPVAQIELAVDGRYAMNIDDSRAPVSRSEPIKATAVTRIPNGFRIGRRDIAANVLEIIPDRPPAIWVGERQYRGRLRLVRQPGGKMLVVNVLALEDYIASVVDGEMPATFPDAARQAQAIVARSYVLFQLRGSRVSPAFDVYASTRSQNYGGYQYRGRDGRRYAAETESGRRAAQTARMICLCDGQPFCTYYTAVCGGHTAGGATVFNDDSPALVPVACAWCQDAELYRWTQELSLDDVSERLQILFSAQGKPFGRLTSIRRTQEPATIRDSAFEVSDGTHRYRLSRFDLRRQLNPSNVPSYQFDIHVAHGQLELQGRGHGHGVGLCQWGARGLALSGSGPLAILRHYYQGVEVVAVR